MNKNILFAMALGLGACASNPPPQPSDAEKEQIRQDHERAQNDMDNKMEQKDERQQQQQPQAGSAAGSFVLASYQAKPAWVTKPNVKHPSSSYLVGVGQGSSKAGAENDAQAAIAKQFEAKIKAATTVTQKYFQNSKGSAKSIGVDKAATVGTDKVIKGVQIAESAVGGGTYYALAVLERGPAAQRLREEIEKLDGEIAAKIKAGDGASDKIKAFRSYGAALEKLEMRTILNADLQVVDPSGGGIKAPIDWADVNSKFEGAQENLKVGIEVSAKVNVANLEGRANAESARIEACIKEATAKMGLEFQDDDDDLDMILKAEAMFQPVDVTDGQFLVNVEMNMQVVNVKKNNKVMSTWTDRVGKVGRSNWIGSVSTAATKICVQSVPKIAENLKKFMSK